VFTKTIGLLSSDKRVFILTRSAFAGQQRYGANTWSGDVVASWETLRNQISGGLNFSLCGIPHYNSDIGGFFLWNYKNDLSNPDYRELYVRLASVWCLLPHDAFTRRRRPSRNIPVWQKGERVYDAIEKYINLRYSLLPYVYSTSWDVTANQSSMMRALVMDFANDKDALDINDQYMFGKSFWFARLPKVCILLRWKADFSTVKSDRSVFAQRNRLD
jgi:alpha-D-xyloside xylohydrolase